MVIFKGVTHSAIAVTFYLMVDDFYDSGIALGWVMACLILGSLLADIDHPKSTLGRYIPISGVFKHRNGFTHSFLGAFIFPLPILYFGIDYYFITIWGYLLHLLADTLTPMGVRWLYPLTKKRYSLKLAKTGGIEEAIIVILCIMFIFEKSWL